MIYTGCLQIAIDGLARMMCMAEYLPDVAPKPTHQPHRKHSTAGRASRSGSTIDGATGEYGATRPRRQSAYPNYSRPPAATHSRRRQHSIAYTTCRSTLSDEKIVESGVSPCPSSRQFPCVPVPGSPCVSQFQTVRVPQFQTFPGCPSSRQSLGVPVPDSPCVPVPDSACVFQFQTVHVSQFQTVPGCPSSRQSVSWFQTVPVCSSSRQSLCPSSRQSLGVPVPDSPCVFQFQTVHVSQFQTVPMCPSSRQSLCVPVPDSPCVPVPDSPCVSQFQTVRFLFLGSPCVFQFQTVRVCPSSRQFSPPSTSSPSRIRHSRTELIANQVPMLPMSNHISSRSLDVVDEVVGRSRRCAGGHLFPSAAGRPSTASTNGGRVLSPFDELGEPSPTSLSRSSTSRGDSGGSPAPLYDGWSGQSNTETTAAAAADLPPTVTLHVSASTRADLVDIRSMLAAYMKRLADKDATASVTKEWRIVAKVFDRLFFFLYCATIIVSLLTIFPRS